MTESGKNYDIRNKNGVVQGSDVFVVSVMWLSCNIKWKLT